jgi:hypothetical protein
LYNENVRSRLLVALFLVACTRTETVTRFVTLHQTQSCMVPSGSSGKYVATGDFQPLAENLAQQALAIDAAGLTIDGVPGNVKSLALLAESPTPSAVWLGAALVPDTGDVDMLLLPQTSACALNGNGVGFDGQMVFAAVSSKTIIALGATVGGSTPSYRIDLTTGRVAKMTNPIGKPRTSAAVATFGDSSALVIGGLSGLVAQQTFELFDETNEFSPVAFQLQTARADHGAVALANGDVFVAGGAGVGNALIAQTERLTFDGTTWRSNQSTTPALQVARTNPYVLRLADGTVMVGGGLDVNAAPVTLVEFFSADGSTALQPTNVPATGANAFVALDGGGALFVDASAPQHAWFVAPNVSIQITPDVSGLTDVKLFPRAGGGALLWTGTTWLAFDPWTGFSALAGAPSSGPDASSPITSPDPGMQAWVAPDGSGGGNVVVWRDAVRNAFATEGPYLVSDTSFMTPDAVLAPMFTNGALPLSSTQAAFVADARYLDVAVQVDGAHIVIRAPSGEVDVGDCVGPIQPSETLYVERHGATVTFAQNGGPLIPCAAIDPSARVAVGVRGNGAARNLVVKRLGTALP